jgi:hypothetical protein
MSKYDKDPAQGDASLEATSNALREADDAVSDAEARLEEAEEEVDAANAVDDSAAALAAAERVNMIDQELMGLRQDFESAEQHHNENVKFWGL